MAAEVHNLLRRRTSLKRLMIAKGCKRSVRNLFHREEPKRHDEDSLAGVPYSLCCSQMILARHLNTHILVLSMWV